MELIKFNSKIKVNSKEDNVISLFNNVEYLVLPMTILVEGVLNGGLYPLDEIEKSVNSWNGRPATLNHPTIDGIYVSANTPLVLENTQLGFVFNAKMEGNKLVAEAWVEAINYEKIKNITEVSTGLFVDSELVIGEFNGIKYDYIAHNFKTDHLALLPEGTIGACSGSGITINEKENDLNEDKITTNTIEEFSCGELLTNGEKNDKFPLVNWFKVNVLQKFTGQLKANEASFDAKWDLVKTELRKKFKTEANWVGIEDMFDTFVIFWIEEDIGWKFYKMDYTISENDTMAVLSGEKVEVMPKLTYEPVNSSILTNEDEKIEVIKGNDNNETGGDPVKEPIKDGGESPKVNEETKFTAAEVAAMVDSGIEKGVAAGIAAYKVNEAKEAETANKAALIETITANEKCIFSKETLEKFNVNELKTESERLGAPTPDYSGNTGAEIKNNEKTKASSIERAI